MPTYEYECTKCQHHFELQQSMNDKPRSRCPQCRGKVRRLISGGLGISFKGSGYYVNDSRAAAKTAQTAKTAKAAKAAEPAKTKIPPPPKDSGA